MCCEPKVVSRVKISGEDQPKNLAILIQQGYDIYFIESTIESEPGGRIEPYFYYEAWRNDERIRAVTPHELLQLAHENKP